MRPRPRWRPIWRTSGTASRPSATAQRAWEQGLDPSARQKQSQAVRDSFDTPFEKRDRAKNRVVFAAFIDQAKGLDEHRKALDTIRAGMPKFPTTMVVRERSGPPRETHLLVKGDFTRPGQGRRAGRAVGPPADEVEGGEGPRGSSRPRPVAVRAVPPAHGAGRGQPDLAGPLRPRPGRDRERLRHPGWRRHRTRPCSTGSRRSSSASAGARRRCTG